MTTKEVKLLILDHSNKQALRDKIGGKWEKAPQVSCPDCDSDDPLWINWTRQEEWCLNCGNVDTFETTEEEAREFETSKIKGCVGGIQ